MIIKLESLYKGKNIFITLTVVLVLIVISMSIILINKEQQKTQSMYIEVDNKEIPIQLDMKEVLKQQENSVLRCVVMQDMLGNIDTDKKVNEQIQNIIKDAGGEKSFLEKLASNKITKDQYVENLRFNYLYNQLLTKYSKDITISDSEIESEAKKRQDLKNRTLNEIKTILIQEKAVRDLNEDMDKKLNSTNFNVIWK